jgi:hypothetical protein
MPNEIRGWYKIWRRSRQHWLWNMKPFDRWHAWEYLISWAAHSREDRVYQQQAFILDRGQHVTTRNQLRKDWGWSWAKTNTFLETLVRLEMIREATERGCVLVTICKFDTWQGRAKPTGRQDAMGPGRGREEAGNELRRSRRRQRRTKENAGPQREALPSGLTDVAALSPERARETLTGIEKLNLPLDPDLRQKLVARAGLPA